MNLPERMWINQPSTRQPLHRLHGTNVLAMRESGGTYRIYFLSGSVVSMQASALALSRGWRSPSPQGDEQTCPTCCGHGVVGQRTA